MADNLPLLFLPTLPDQIDFTTVVSGRGNPRIPERNRVDHGNNLKVKFDRLWATYDSYLEERTAASLPTRDGIYVEFRGQREYDLIFQSLEGISQGIRLCNIRKDYYGVDKAIVYIPNNQRGYLLKKITEYLSENTNTDKPKNEKLINSISDIQEAVIESFWQDDIDVLPGELKEWCELWIINGITEGAIQERTSKFLTICEELDVSYKSNVLHFPERSIFLLHANRADLLNIILAGDFIAEIRRAQDTTSFFTSLENIDQLEWVEEMRSRISREDDLSTSITVLDAGANNGHKLLDLILVDDNCQSVYPDWGISDNRNTKGHGTNMCGIAAYGDIQKVALDKGPIELRHFLESVKILPPTGDNHPELYGDITKQAVSLSEIKNPSINHIYCLAVSSKYETDKGRPSSWSAALDELSSGGNDDKHRLFIVSAGNISIDDKDQYPESNLASSIESPGQSWNSVTVGSVTNKRIINEDKYRDYRTVAPINGLSPFSRTSRTWNFNRWPIKPDIVFEGGNLAVGPDGFVSELEDLSMLTVSHTPTKRQFEAFNMTSASSSFASWFAAQIQSLYPEAWPETVRALMVHSASWNDALLKQFSIDLCKKNDILKLLRIVGYGTPSLSDAIGCMQNQLTMVVEQSIQPFYKEGTAVKTKDMHLYELPWPKEELQSLGDSVVEIKITLSYFVEPGPGSVGWGSRYKYPSHALRFDMAKPTESQEFFVKRINKALREDGEKGFSGNNWLIGDARNVGSIHSDIWTGTGVEAAECNFVGVFPVTGWWKDRPYLNNFEKSTRYSLVLSVKTKELEVDIYNPVKLMIEIPTTIEIKT